MRFTGYASGILLPDYSKLAINQKNDNDATIYWHFFLTGFSLTDTDDSQDSRGREGNIFYSTLPLSPAHEHSEIYLQLCM